MFKRSILLLISTYISINFGILAYAKQVPLKPFVLAAEVKGKMQVAEQKLLLTNAGFQILGEVKPYAQTYILIITNKELQSIATMSQFGAYGSVVRVAITKKKDISQVSYTYPPYWANAYRMKKIPKDTTSKLAKTLGFIKLFGSDEGISAENLRSYHYMFGMPYFDEPDLLGNFSSNKKAIEIIENGLARNLGGVSKVYRLDLPKGGETIIGVHMTKDMSSDRTIMQDIDQGKLSHTAHLPYEIVISKGKAYALNARFRIAISFPDLTMAQFAGIMSAPSDIESALKAVTGQKD